MTRKHFSYLFSALFLVVLASAAPALTGTPEPVVAMAAMGEGGTEHQTINVPPPWPPSKVALRLEGFDTFGGTRELVAVEYVIDCYSEASADIDISCTGGEETHVESIAELTIWPTTIDPEVAPTVTCRSSGLIDAIGGSPETHHTEGSNVNGFMLTGDLSHYIEKEGPVKISGYGYGANWALIGCTGSLSVYDYFGSISVSVYYHWVPVADGKTFAPQKRRAYPEQAVNGLAATRAAAIDTANMLRTGTLTR